MGSVWGVLGSVYFGRIDQIPVICVCVSGLNGIIYFNLLEKHNLIVFQDENIKGWQAGLFGKSVQLGSLGRIKTVLKRTETAKMISKFAPTTQMCPKCQAMHKQSLNERDYSCSCGYYHPSRDIKAALTALTVYVFNLTPLEQRSLLGEAVSYTSFFELFQFLEMKQDKPMTQEAHSLE